MSDQSDRLRTLVRRDLAVLLVGGVLAIWLAAVMLVARAGLVGERRAATITVAVGSVIIGGCLVWWAAGPRRWLRDRYLVLVPVFLAAPSVALALYDLGAGFAALTVSAALGFGAAIALGLAVASRRRG